MNRRHVMKAIVASGAALLMPVFSGKKVRAATLHKVDIRGFRFLPKNLEVRVGDTIRFTNQDGVEHTATANNRSWDTKSLSRGDSSDILVSDGMHEKYFCRFHPSMKATLRIIG